MGDDGSLRCCKAFLRRRLAYGPPVVERESDGQLPPEQQGEGAGERGSSAWGHLWPLGRATQCEDLRRVLRRTIFDGESQSALLLGSTGTGKSLVLDRVLRSLAQEVASKATATTGRGKRKRQKETAEERGGREAEAKAGATERRQQQRRHQHQRKQPFRAVYLNGAAQVDDGVAMREIVQQLGITGAATQGSIYNSNLAMMVESMKTGTVNGVPVIFVLDDFERFTCRKPQTLLYALLDLCQDKTICAAVVGLSVNLNVLDAAEKRVKSRFSFRQVRESLCYAKMVDGKGEGRKVEEKYRGRVGGQKVESRGGYARQAAEEKRRKSPINRHSVSIVSAAAALRCRSTSALADLKELAASGRSVGWFLRLASTAVGLLRDEDRGLTRRAVVRAGELLAPDTHALALQSLAVTQTLVLVAIVRLERRGRKKDGCSFEAVFREYGSYLRQFRTCHLRFSRAVIFKAFGQLVEQGILRSAESGTGGGREAHPVLHSRFRSRFDIEEVSQAVAKIGNANVAQWCKRWQKQ
ncbi:unnamed protein product [Scytosiphon promiscuus]